MQYGKYRLACVYIIVICIQGTHSNSEKSSIRIADYLYPKFFWPFDYQTTAAEVIENVNVVENGPIGITGEKPGYCRFHFHQTSVTLGTFTLKCLRKPSDCKDGLTMAFWIRLTDVTFHKESILKEEVSILRTSHSAYAQHYGIRIWYSVLKGDVKLHASVILNEEQVTEVSINAMEWYHVVLSFSVNSGLQFFVNFKRSRMTSRHKHATLNINEVKLFLGQYPITRGIGNSLLSSKLSIDNLAIWNRLLNRNDVSKVYLAGLSHINVHKGCLNDKNQFAVTWNGTADYYSHLRNYQVVWWSGKNGGSEKEASRIVLPSNFSTVTEKELNIVIDFFELSTLYNVRIDAHTKANITFGTEIQCSTGDSTKGNTLKIVAVNPFTLSVIWKSIDESKYFVYKVTCKQINGELVFDKRTTTLSLNVTIGNLLPQTDYKVYIERLDTTTLIKSYYTGNPNTLPLSSFVRTSVLKAEVVGATWSTAKLRFILHPELKEHHMRYIVKQTGDGKVISKRFSVMLMDKIDMDIKGLHENTTYAFDVQLFDKRSAVAGPNMSVPLIVTTNVRFPPPIDMFIINATAKTITLSITLPSLMAKTHLHVTHLKVSLSLQHHHEHKIIKINEFNHIVWNNLEQYTTYQISAVTGDSEGNYGEVGKVISAMTLDEDECNQAEIRCPPNSKCLNTLGSYRCPCLQGFMESHSKCEDLDECSRYNVCMENAICNNTYGSFECHCSVGFMKIDGICEDINECNIHSPCDENAVCQNTPGSFHCNCKDGFEMTDKGCSDKNECLLFNVCAENADCYNLHGSFNCTCRNGYSLLNDSCIDINECHAHSICDENSNCVNTAGSYKCICKQGFVLMNNKCQDVNECESVGVCGRNSVCHNLPGSYQCSCLKGFLIQNTTCKDQNECLEQQEICGNHSICTNTQGSYLCSCIDGFSMMDEACKDIDECVTKSICGNHSICINTIGSYKCKCSDGFVMKNAVCQDADECRHEVICGNHSICVNTFGSYHCQCEDGYVMADSICEDINECQIVNICGNHSICKNSIGSYECSCKSGFVMKDGQCKDLNECFTDNICGNHSICENSIGSYECSCKSGFEMKDGQCKDLNECFTDNICGNHSICENSIGSYECSCKSGFVMKDGQCKDLNECFTDNICGNHSICENSIGSYECSCKSGFEMKDGQCKDLNECFTDNICGNHSICENSIGSYECSCKSGFVMKDGQCKDLNECFADNICGNHSICENSIGSYECSCKSGFVMKDGQCKDLNECFADNICGNHSICENSIGSYECSCKSGFEMKDGQCKDLNECFTDNICGNHSICENSIGSFECSCKSGFVMKDGQCKDINECMQVNVCDMTEKCMNTFGSYKCVCKDGFYKNNNTCTAINEKSMCDRQMMRNVVWQPTEIGFIASSPCPDGKTGNASRPCMNSTSGKPMWGEMDLSECISKEMTNILLMQPLKRDELQVAKKIDTFVSNEPDMFGGDLRQVVNLMDGLVATNKTKEDAFARTMVNITSSLLKKSTKKAWNDLPQEKRSKDAAKLLETSDTVVEVSANIMLKKQRSKSIVTENIVMHLQKLSPADVINETEIQVVSAKLPIEVFSGNVTVATVTYNGLSDLIGVPKNTKLSKESSNITINSKIISVSLFPQIKETFEKPVVIVHKLTKNVIDKVPNCVFWESERQSWSHEGCKVSKSNESHVTCNCHHLTNFAVLMSVTDVADNLAGDHRFALNLITIIGISISLAALVASFFTFLMVRAIHSLRNTIHQHLVVALFIAEGLFLFGIDKTDSKVNQFTFMKHTMKMVGCQVIAASLHYFFLVAFAIMALEGIVLYLMLVRVYRSMGTSGYGSAKYIAICWVVPIIFIVINVAIDQDSYAENRDFCWLSIKHGFIWTFVGPIIFIIMMNIVILFMTLRIMSVKGKKRTSTSEEIWFWIRGCFLLLSILGVTWIIGVFYVDMNTVFVAYLFNVINSLQGMSIFIFHCLCDPRVRKAYYNFFCCVRSRHQSFLRSNSRTRTTSTGSKTSLKKSKRKYKLSTEKGDDVPLYLNGATPDISILGGRSTSTPDDSFGVLVGTNKF